MLDTTNPKEIEARSFALIEQELTHPLDPQQAPIIKRVIHTTADFDYAKTLVFSPNVVALAKAALQEGASIVTDTQMAMAGINKARLGALGGQAHCFMSDEDVALEATQKGCTRATICMDKAAKLKGPLIFAIGNAPTALLRLRQLIDQGVLQPKLIIGVPVGFVNVVQSKEIIMETNIPYIVAKGRKGGSNVAAAICNALLYSL